MLPASFHLARAGNRGRSAFLGSRVNPRFARIAGVAALIAAALATRLYSSQNDEDARAQAWVAAQRAIPQFLTWAQPTSIYPCGVAKTGSGEIDLTESLLFNPVAAARLCSNQSTAPFESGSVLAAAFWFPLSRTKDATRGSQLDLRVRGTAPKDDVALRKIRIVIPEDLLRDVAGCTVNDFEGVPAQPGVEDVSLENFYWIQLKPGESYQTAACGDFAVLMGFHLVHKVAEKGWLWSTFWWDDSHSPPFGSAPAMLRGSWSNYAMDAAYDNPQKEIYNPWRDSEIGNRNCAACHEKLATSRESTEQPLTFDMVITARTHF